MRVADYHRTIIGYHGTRRPVALEIVQRLRGFDPSRNPGDWLGHGIYFWEHAPRQALAWAEQRKRRGGWKEDVAVLGAMIQLRNCLDLLDPLNTEYLCQIFERRYKPDLNKLGAELPKNVLSQKVLDCRVMEYAYAAIDSERGVKVDSCRAVYVPTGENKRVWPSSWIVRQAHIQVCVRNPSCILGVWLESEPTHEAEEDR